jgi:hypothetical protein
MDDIAIYTVVKDIRIGDVFSYKTARVEARIGEMKVFGEQMPSWLLDSLPYASAALSILGAVSEHQHRQAVSAALNAIYKKLEQIESRIEDLHDKIDSMAKNIKGLEGSIDALPSEIAMHLADGFVLRWRELGAMNDDEFDVAFGKFNEQFYALLANRNSKWFSLHVPKFGELLACYLSSLSRYELQVASKNESDEELATVLARDSFERKRQHLKPLLEDIKVSIEAHYQSSLKEFYYAWNSSVLDRKFGFKKEHHRLKADWNTRLRDMANYCTIPDDEFLRLIEVDRDLRFTFSDRSVPKKYKALFWLYNHVKLNQSSGLFEEVCPMLIFPQNNVEMVKRSSSVSTGQLFSLVGDDSFPVSKWEEVFTLGSAYKQNERFKSKYRRHEKNMKLELGRINDAWKTLVIIGGNLKIADELVETICTVQMIRR